MIGQDYLVNKINTLTLTTMSKSLIIEGKRGSGKHTLFNLLIDRLGLECIDITNTISLDLINEIVLRPVNICYLVNIDEITTKEQNMLLKILEEPVATCYFVLLCTDESLVLPTIRNRCQKWSIAPYTEGMLYKFCSDYTFLKDILSIAETPGEVLLLQTYNISELKQLALNIINNIANASYSNIFVLCDKVRFKDENNNCDIILFVKILLKTMLEEYVKGNTKLVEPYKLTNNLYKILNSGNRVNKQYEYENYLFTLKQLMKNG